MRTHLWLGLALSVSLGCGGDGGDDDPDGGGTPDAGPIDDDGGGQPDGMSTIDAGPSCGTEILPVGDIQGTEGLAIGPDGTIYYSQSQSVGRRVPGGAAEDQWVPIPGANTIYGLALGAAGARLYVASPTTDTIYEIDTTADVPAATPILTMAGMSPNGIVVGPDGLIYYSDFGGGRVYRIAAGGTRVEVTQSQIAAPNGLFFESPTSLLVLAYFDGEIWRLTLDGSMNETGRALVTTVTGAALDGIARDDTGRWYVSDNGNGELIRLDASFANPEVLLTNVDAAANIVFGKGSLVCTDIYVASSGDLGHYVGDATGTP